MTRLIFPLAALGMLAGCQGTDNPKPGDVPTFSGIAPEETIHLTGTEPFWGGEISGQKAIYSTPENPEGTQFAVSRFAGNNGLSYSGSIDGVGFDLTVTPGDCSDGMSDRTYPYTSTLTIGGEMRRGCAWTEKQPFKGPENP